MNLVLDPLTDMCEFEFRGHCEIHLYSGLGIYNIDINCLDYICFSMQYTGEYSMIRAFLYKCVLKHVTDFSTRMVARNHFHILPYGSSYLMEKL